MQKRFISTKEMKKFSDLKKKKKISNLVIFALCFPNAIKE